MILSRTIVERESPLTKRDNAVTGAVDFSPRGFTFWFFGSRLFGAATTWEDDHERLSGQRDQVIGEGA